MGKFDGLLKRDLIRGRVCKNCSGPIPKPKNKKAGNIKRKMFCEENCRKEFHRNNGISVHRLKVQVREWVRDELKALGITAPLSELAKAYGEK